MAGKKYLESSEIQKMFKVTRVTLLKWRRQGCPCRKRGQTWLYDPAQIEAWLRDREMKTGRAREAKSTRKVNVKGKMKVNAKDSEEEEGDQGAGGLTRSIEQLNQMRRSVFDMAKTAIEKKDAVEANRLLGTFKDLIETLRKAAKDDIELRRMTGELIPRAEAEEFCKLLCSSFKSGLYQQVDEMADEVLTGLLGLEIGIEEKSHDPVIVCVKEIITGRFDNILSQLNRKFEERDR